MPKENNQTCIHELAQKLDQPEFMLELQTQMTDVSACSLLHAVRDGKITVEQLTTDGEKGISIQEVKEITSQYDKAAVAA